MAALLDNVEKYVFDLFKDELPAHFTYHNFLHTQRVVKSTNEIIEHYKIDVKDKEALLLAAWLHDIGYTRDPDNHEEESIRIAKEFLTDHGISEDQIEKVEACIRATKMSHTPTNLMEEIIRDADSSHFAKEYFLETSELLREELAQRGIKEYTTKEWLEENVNILTNGHKYYTEYAFKNWNKNKDQNILNLLEKRKKKKKKERKEELKAKLKAKYKDDSPERAIQTLYRVTLRNHIKLSDIADTKANILLSVNAIIISLALSNLLPKLDNPSNTYLLIPTFIFIFFSIVAMVLSVLATRPNVTRGDFTREDVEKKRVNLLFFGNFHRMNYEDYEWAMGQVIQDKTYLYNSLTKDLYFLGKVLDTKYRILRLTYTIFILGIIVSVLAFALSFKVYHPEG